jgi:hypothetical protein
MTELLGMRWRRMLPALTLLPLLAAGGCEAIIGLHEPPALDASVTAQAGTGKAGSGGRGGAGGASDEKTSMCQAFCKRANETCTGDYAIYHGAADCEPACQLLSIDQIKCRDQQVSAARTSNEFWDHCQGAAIGGSTACGGNCENYCAFMDVVCTDKNRLDGMLSMPDCVKKCGALRDREVSLMGQPANTSRLNIDRDHEGDSLQCRLVHLSIAAGPGAADAHCWHAAISPKPEALSKAPNPCATEKSQTEPRCDDYCQIVNNACIDDDKVYENRAQCLASCGELVKGDAADSMGDTVGCRKTHAFNALLLGTPPHCPHAGPGGAGICGNDCPAYCRLFKAGCDAAFKDAFGTATDATSKCESACSTLRGPDPLKYSVAAAGAKNANPIACRLLYATRALEHPDQQATLCKSAAGTPDSSCKP